MVLSLLIVEDQDRSRDSYTKVLGAEVVIERDPEILRFHNSRTDKAIRVCTDLLGDRSSAHGSRATISSCVRRCLVD